MKNVFRGKPWLIALLGIELVFPSIDCSSSLFTIYDDAKRHGKKVTILTQE